jgi:hypothetical protein
VKRRSYSRTSAGIAWFADTQCSVAFTRRPSGASPPAGGRIVGAAHFHDLAAVVLDHLRAGDEVGAAEAHFLAGRQPEELLRRFFTEVVALDVQHARERHPASAGGRILRVVDDVDVFDLILGIVREDDLQRTQYAHDPRRALVQILADAVFELGDVDDVLFSSRRRCANRNRESTRACSRGDAVR